MLAWLLLPLCLPASAGPRPPALAELEALAGGGAPLVRPEPPRGAALRGGPATGTLVVELYGGRREPLALGPRRVLLRVWDGAQRERFVGWVTGPRVRLEGLPLRDNADDLWRVVAWAPGRTTAGLEALRLSARAPATAPLLLLPSPGRLDFARARWDALPAFAPRLRELLSDEPSKRELYERLLRERPDGAASLLNAFAAASAIRLEGRPVTSYYKALVQGGVGRSWFYAYADARLLELVRSDRRFRPERWPRLFHPDATASYKQVEFEVANLQLTFDEKDRRVIDGVPCVRVETDMDLYRDALSHFLLEIVPALGSRDGTDPRDILSLRWTAGRLGGQPDFDPLYDVL